MKEIKDVIGSALETHIASVHDDITDSRSDMKLDCQLSANCDRYTAAKSVGSTAEMIANFIEKASRLYE